ncbi:MAG: response regulator [Longimicrobiales bacterium]
MPPADTDRPRTVLILDDDASVRTTLARTLALYDYHVLEAGDAQGAFRVLTEYSEPIDLILCDLVLPGLGGREAANTLLARRPEARIVYISGYSTHDSFRRSLEESGVPFLGKPFEIAELLRLIDEVLRGEPDEGADGSENGS